MRSFCASTATGVRASARRMLRISRSVSSSRGMGAAGSRRWGRHHGTNRRRQGFASKTTAALTNKAPTAIFSIAITTPARAQAARQAGPATVHHTQRPPQSTGGPGLPVRAAPRAAATPSRWPGLPPRRTGSAVRPQPSATRRKHRGGGAIPAPPAGRALPGNTGRSHCRARPRLAWAVPQAAATRRAQKAGSCQGNAQKGWRERDDGHGRRGNQSSVW